MKYADIPPGHVFICSHGAEWLKLSTGLARCVTGAGMHLVGAVKGFAPNTVLEV